MQFVPDKVSWYPNCLNLINEKNEVKRRIFAAYQVFGVGKPRCRPPIFWLPSCSSRFIYSFTHSFIHLRSRSVSTDTGRTSNRGWWGNRRGRTQRSESKSILPSKGQNQRSKRQKSSKTESEWLQRLVRGKLTEFRGCPLRVGAGLAKVKSCKASRAWPQKWRHGWGLLLVGVGGQGVGVRCVKEKRYEQTSRKTAMNTLR